MWEINTPEPVKLIIGILASDDTCRQGAVEAIQAHYGRIDTKSDVWPFTQTKYYNQEMGSQILRQFVTIEKLISPGDLAQVKHDSNAIEQGLARSLAQSFPRPVNLDPGFIEPSKLVLASTKNFSHRIYIGKQMYAEVTLVVDRGQWSVMRYTYPDYQTAHYWEFFERVRQSLLAELKAN